MPHAKAVRKNVLMGPFEAVDFLLAFWLLSASAILIYMVRRGHNPTRWVVIAFLTGPFAILAAAWARRQAKKVRSRVQSWGTQGGGALSVLVGVDGSAAAHDAAVGAVAAFGDRLGRLTLATVIDFESAAAEDPSDARLAAEALLSEEALSIRLNAGIDPRTVVLAGSPASALVEHALSANDTWLVIGTHGKGDAEWLQGSAAAILTDHPPVPIMVIGGTAHLAVDTPIGKPALRRNRSEP